MKAIFILFVGLLLNATESYYDRGTLVKLEVAKEVRALSKSDIKYFTTQSGKRVGVKNELLVKCKAKINCVELLKIYKQKDIKQISSTIYKVKVQNDGDVFSLSRKLFESGEVEFAHPNLTKTVTKR